MIFNAWKARGPKLNIRRRQKTHSHIRRKFKQIRWFFLAPGVAMGTLDKPGQSAKAQRLTSTRGSKWRQYVELHEESPNVNSS